MLKGYVEGPCCCGCCCYVDGARIEGREEKRGLGLLELTLS